MTGSSQEFWRRRIVPSSIPASSSSSSSRCDFVDELYIRDSTAVWTREGQESKPVSFGSSSSNPDSKSRSAQIVRTFTVDSQIKDAVWTTFKNKVNSKDLEREFKEKNLRSGEDYKDGEMAIGAVGISSSAVSSASTTTSSEESLVILESTILSARTWSGSDHVAFLPFPVSRMWPIKDGILVERDAGAADVVDSPTMFTLSHPLDEFKPVLTRIPTSIGAGDCSFAKEHFYTSANITS